MATIRETIRGTSHLQEHEFKGEIPIGPTKIVGSHLSANPDTGEAVFENPAKARLVHYLRANHIPIGSHQLPNLIESHGPNPALTVVRYSDRSRKGGYGTAYYINTTLPEAEEFLASVRVDLASKTTQTAARFFADHGVSVSSTTLQKLYQDNHENHALTRTVRPDRNKKKGFNYRYFINIAHPTAQQLLDYVRKIPPRSSREKIADPAGRRGRRIKNFTGSAIDAYKKGMIGQHVLLRNSRALTHFLREHGIACAERNLDKIYTTAAQNPAIVRIPKSLAGGIHYIYRVDPKMPEAAELLALAQTQKTESKFSVSLGRFFRQHGIVFAASRFSGLYEEVSPHSALKRTGHGVNVTGTHRYAYYVDPANPEFSTILERAQALAKPEGKLSASSTDPNIPIIDKYRRGDIGWPTLSKKTISLRTFLKDYQIPALRGDNLSTIYKRVSKNPAIIAVALTKRKGETMRVFRVDPSQPEAIDIVAKARQFLEEVASQKHEVIVDRYANKALAYYRRENIPASTAQELAMKYYLSISTRPTGSFPNPQAARSFYVRERQRILREHRNRQAESTPIAPSDNKKSPAVRMPVGHQMEEEDRRHFNPDIISTFPILEARVLFQRFVLGLSYKDIVNSDGIRRTQTEMQRRTNYLRQIVARARKKVYGGQQRVKVAGGRPHYSGGRINLPSKMK